MSDYGSVAKAEEAAARADRCWNADRYRAKARSWRSSSFFTTTPPSSLATADSGDA